MDGERRFLPHNPQAITASFVLTLMQGMTGSASMTALRCDLASLHNDLLGITMRFREKYIALSGEVSDMFCHMLLRRGLQVSLISMA